MLGTNVKVRKTWTRNSGSGHVDTISPTFAAARMRCGEMALMPEGVISDDAVATMSSAVWRSGRSSVHCAVLAKSRARIVAVLQHSLAAIATRANEVESIYVSCRQT